MRWGHIIGSAILVGLLQFLLGTRLPYPQAPGELVFLMAFLAMSKGVTMELATLLWFCGLIRDFFLGERLGVSAFIYLLCGLFVFSMRRQFPPRLYWLQWLLLPACLIFILAVRPLLEQRVWIEVGIAGRAALDGTIYTLLFLPVMALLLKLSAWQFRPEKT